jgi:hypothetical protein
MNKQMKNPFANPDKSGRAVRKIVVLGMVCMLLFAVLSCDNANDIEESEIFTSEFYILKSIGTDGCDWVFAPHCSICDGPCFSFASPAPWRAVPVNLSEKFQRNGLYVNVRFRQLSHQRCNYDAIEIIKIEEIK